MVSRIGLVALHVFKENVRDRVLYAIAAFAVILVAASILIGQITAGQDVKIIKDLGLATIELAGLLITVFIGVGLVAREIERRSIYGVLSKPLPRWEFIIGKYFGLVLTVFVNIAAMTVAFYLVLAWLGWISPENVRASWVRPATDPQLLIAIVLIAAEMALLTAVSLFFSTFSSSTLLSVCLTVGLFIAGLLSQDLRHFGDIVDVSAVVAMVVAGVGWVIPAFSAFDVKGSVVSGVPVPVGYVVETVAYAVVYASAALVGAVTVFSRREFT